MKQLLGYEIVKTQLFVDVLTQIMEGFAEALINDGWSFFTTDDAPETYQALDGFVSMVYEETGVKVIPVADYGLETTTMPHDLGILIRFIHDYFHLSRGLDFSLESEIAISNLQVERIEGVFENVQELMDEDKWAEKYPDVTFDRLKLAMALFMKFDFEGQARYYDLHKEFVKDQDKFIQDCFQWGMDVAVQEKQV